MCTQMRYHWITEIKSHGLRPFSVELEKYSSAWMEVESVSAITSVDAVVGVIMQERTWHVKNKSLVSYLVSVIAKIQS